MADAFAFSLRCQLLAQAVDIRNADDPALVTRSELHVSRVRKLRYAPQRLVAPFRSRSRRGDVVCAATNKASRPMSKPADVRPKGATPKPSGQAWTVAGSASQKLLSWPSMAGVTASGKACYDP